MYDPWERTPKYQPFLPPLEWYQYPPIEAGAPKPFDQTRLGRLPLFIRQQIIECLCYGSDIMDVTIRREYDRRAPSLNLVRQFGSVLATCRQLRKEALAYLASSTITSCQVLTLPSLPQDIGPHNVQWIQYLQVKTHFFLKTRHEHHFPHTLSFLCEQLPNLMRFELFSYYKTDAVPLPRHEAHDLPTTTRHQQEARALLRFGAFLVLRHPNLDLLIWPCDSGPTYEQNASRTLAYIDVISNNLNTGRGPCAKKLAEGDEQHTIVEVSNLDALASRIEANCMQDRVLSSTKLRRFLWAELPTVNLDELTIPKSSTSSEVEEGT